MPTLRQEPRELIERTRHGLGSMGWGLRMVHRLGVIDRLPPTATEGSAPDTVSARGDYPAARRRLPGCWRPAASRGTACWRRW